MLKDPYWRKVVSLLKYYLEQKSNQLVFLDFLFSILHFFNKYILSVITALWKHTVLL